ncbi:MAG: hypothetical protein H6895_07280 [Defluviimonas sp.]|uniref:hypothetical protein n=1 Tax=Albidovulum sp. TaxID=1872424 RepID=UPI001D1A7D8B|nr:hypothetical protein [Paracoccaceae bacterium]MCC0063872.1 hypothetical protein [Defluviimonas sp.]
METPKQMQAGDTKPRRDKQRTQSDEAGDRQPQREARTETTQQSGSVTFRDWASI